MRASQVRILMARRVCRQSRGRSGWWQRILEEGGKTEAELSGRASSLGTAKCVQISTYILVQHLSCAVLFCILCERLQKNVVAFIAKLLNCLTE